MAVESKTDSKIEIRIGLHHGNVVVKDDDLFGNEVNLCSRIEGTAVPGGIALSRVFLDEIEGGKKIRIWTIFYFLYNY